MKGTIDILLVVLKYKSLAPIPTFSKESNQTQVAKKNLKKSESFF